MAEGMTKAVQETVVGEGLALGCLQLKVASMTSNRLSLESAFRRAWTSWPQVDQFPGIHASLARTDLMHIVRHSTRRRGLVLAQWEEARVLSPVLVWGDTAEEAGELLEETSGVPFMAWVALADAFIEGLGADKVHHEE